MSEQAASVSLRHRDNYLPHKMDMEQRSDGALILTSPYPLGEAVQNSGIWLEQWAAQVPERIFIAERAGDAWHEVSYKEALQKVRTLGAALLARGLNENRPLAILSGNSVDHALLSLAAQYIGVPVVPLAEQYSLIPQAHDRLSYILQKVRPAMAYVSDAKQYSQALELDDLKDVEIVASQCAGAPRAVTAFADMLKQPIGAELDDARKHVGPDTLAKILFTSGSTSAPKGVLTTHRMMCVNQVQSGSCFPFFKDKPIKVLDWLPWNHVFGGNNNFNIVLSNGGSYYIDGGKPIKEAFGLTIRNLHEHPGTLAYNVPLGYGMLMKELEKDVELRRKFFGDLDMITYAGASLPLDIWHGLEQYAMEICGSVPLMVSSWGMTETAPSTLMAHEPINRSGVVGVPMPGVTAKLLPVDDGRYELRVKGPNIMPGYFKDPEKTKETFDDEGFMISGDAVRFMDEERPAAGLMFDGRISEDFKLMSGTWVHASKLRLALLPHLSGIAQDLVICGHDRMELGIMIYPSAETIKLYEDAAYIHDGTIIADDVKSKIQAILQELAAKASGSSTRIKRAIMLNELPSLQHHEITSKGSLNTNKILSHRAAIVERLYDDADPAVIKV